MSNYFETNSAYVAHNGNKIVYPFSPPIFQTILDSDFVSKLLETGRKLNIDEDDSNHLLAGNLKYGRSFSYKEQSVKEFEPIIIGKVKEFLNMIDLQFHSNWTAPVIEKVYLEDLWINFSKKHDFNPAHIHNSLLSFVIYCHVPKEIFMVQADSNTKEAGSIVFQYGEKIFDYMHDTFSVEPFENLMFIFPSKLKHYVPPFWVDETRVSVAGNIKVRS